MLVGHLVVHIAHPRGRPRCLHMEARRNMRMLLRRRTTPPFLLVLRWGHCSFVEIRTVLT